MKLISINQDDSRTGIDAVIKENGLTYNAYLQLPHTPDSQHCFLDDTENNDLLIQIAAFIDYRFTNYQLTALTKIGTLDVLTKKVGEDFVVFVDILDVGNFAFLKKDVFYRNYYNRPIFTELCNEDYISNKSLDADLNDALNVLREKTGTA